MKKQALFIDRDGTIILDPPPTYQIDSFEKLEFLPTVLRSLYKIQQETSFECIMVTNQDGLGTPSFTEESFAGPHELMLKTLSSEGVEFQAIHIDKSYPEDQSPFRKPGTGMLTAYKKDPWDLGGSFVIGDRLTDIELAKNLGCKGILIRSKYNLDTVVPENLKQYLALDAKNWTQIADFLCKKTEREGDVFRKTNETEIHVKLNLDGKGRYSIKTGLGFFDHMLEQFAKHALLDVTLEAKGDLHIDPHHLIEDVGIALGQAVRSALGDKKNLERYGYAQLPMDDASASVMVDFGGRSFLSFKGSFHQERLGEFPTYLCAHFFRSFAEHAAANVHIKLKGKDDHHKVEIAFKAFARACRNAFQRNSLIEIASTKGVL